MAENENSLPIGLSMALAHDPETLRAFMRLSDEAQDEIIAFARSGDNHSELMRRLRRLQRKEHPTAEG